MQQEQTALMPLVKEIRKYNPHADLDLIKRAYDFSKKAHTGQKRVSGEDFFIHPFEVAKTMVRLRADSATIAAAFLHDVVEDVQSVPLEKVRHDFGDEIADMVESLTKIDAVKFESRADYTAENIRKILLATAKDLRIILIKLADRLHNMRTLKFLPPDKQKKIAQETMDIYAPIAHKLGINFIKGELEDLALKYLDPDAYTMLAERIHSRREERETRTQEFITHIKSKLKEHGIDAEVQGRAKYFYSIYKKMKGESKDFNEIYDLIAMRILTKTIPECYAALGIVHDIFKPIPKRFKDYIAVPKANGYQSLHTSVVGGHGRILEVQIRTQEMHTFAEEGIASHWRYKGTERDKTFDRKIEWLKQLLEWKQHSESAKDFVETLKIDLFQNEIVVFTPKGDPVSLPENATPVDFAYEVHTNIGNQCSKAEVNGKLVPLDHPLRSGDIVHIITQNNAKPSRNWLTFVKTGKARQKIRAILNIKDEGSHLKAAQKDSEKQLLAKIELPKGTKKVPVKFSKCCTPAYGELIVAFYTKEGRITIHLRSCQNLGSLKGNRQIEVRWKEAEKEISYLKLIIEDRVGLLRGVLGIISGAGINIKEVHTKSRKNRVIITFELVLPLGLDIKQLIPKVRRIGGVIDIKRQK